MKRSGSVGLVVMGAATFAATFAAGTAYVAWSKPAGAAQSNALAPQSCVTRPDGSQDCPPRPRSYSYYFFPSQGWWHWGRSANAGTRPQAVALTNGGSRPYTPVPGASTETVRSGFGTTAKGFTRVSVGG